MIEIVTTADGSHTIYVPELNEHYHSVNGAVQESTYIFINNGFDFCMANPVNIFEVGFGTGLNALLTAIKSINTSRLVNYTAIEKSPLSEEITNSLNYSGFIDKTGSSILQAIHASSWNVPQKITGNFVLNKIRGDLTTDIITGNYDLIYFDAFGPDKQPEMWTREVFKKISEITVRKGTLVTYSAKGDVKRSLKQSGFEVNLLPGPPGKRHIIRAVKI